MPDSAAPNTAEDPKLLLSHYDFEFPKERIAQHPLPERGNARLMIVDRQSQSITHSRVKNLVDFFDSGDCLILNDTKVVAAQLVGTRQKTGGRWQGLFLEPDTQGNWKILCKTRGKLEVGETIVLNDREGRESFSLTMLAKLEGGQWAVSPKVEGHWTDLLPQVGRIPLPHYIRGGKMVDADMADYQTVFAKKPGAVAAPTAGLHFTQEQLQQLTEKGVQIGYITLHVGMGTFKPVQTNRLEDHVMHHETGFVSQEVVAMVGEAKAKGRRAVMVGTTSIRAIESANRGGELIPWEGSTDLFIKPGFQFHTADALMTNFHLPKTTLLVLVHTFGGDQLLAKAYQEAVAREYRFFSYGDSMLIL